MKKWLGLVVLVLVVIMLLSACTTASSTTPATSTAPATTKLATTVPTTAPAAAQPQYGGTFTWIRNTGIPVLGAPPDMPTQTSTYPLASPVMENLVLCDDQENIVPNLAQSVDTSPDGKSITFHLRQGIKFTDGTDFNAAAVKYNLQADVAAKCSGSAILSNVTSYDVVDNYTLRLNLSQYDARLLIGLAQSAIGSMVSPTALAKATTPENAPKDHLVGTGPFLFDSWAKDQFIKFVKNPNYWQGGRPYLDAIEVQNNATTATSVMSFQAKEVNMVENIDPATYNQLKSQGYAVGIPSTLAFVFRIIPDSANADSPFAKLEVREALEYAIDKVGMAQGIGLGTQYPATQLGIAKDAWYIQNYPARNYDVAKAKALLASAGYPNGFSYPLISDVRGRQDQTVAIQTYLKDVGINTTIDVADVARMASLQQNGWKGILLPGFPNWDSFSSWTNVFLNPTLTFPSAAVPAGWVDQWNKVVGTVDFNTRMSMMQAQMKQIYDQALMIPYIYDAPRYVTDGTVMNSQWDAHNINGYFDPADTWLKQK
jgi:peptide/nickel transport system substrate-binding protein